MQHKLPAINLVSYLSLIIVNFLAVQIPFFGRSPGDVSDLYPNLLTPPDFTFKIWSVIYISLGFFIIDQSKSLFQKNAKISAEVLSIGFLFLLSCLLNLGWLITWQSLYITWSFVLIFSLWIVLILLYYRLTQLEKAKNNYTIPFSIYLGWVCISSLANLNVLLIDLEFGFFGLTTEIWTAILIGIGICGTLLVLYLNQDLWFTGVLIWAFFGMYIKNKEIAYEGNEVVTMSLLAMIILLIFGLGIGWRKWRKVI